MAKPWRRQITERIDASQNTIHLKIYIVICSGKGKHNKQKQRTDGRSTIDNTRLVLTKINSC